MDFRKKFRIFIVSFMCTLCVLTLAAGIIQVDYNSRRIGFGDEHTLLYFITGKNIHFDCFIPKL